jgi:hypothetical protein
MLDELVGEEGTQDALDNGPEGAVAGGKASLVGAEELIEVLLDQTEQGRFARPPRPINAGADLHASSWAGGRGTGDEASGGAGRRALSGRKNSTQIRSAIALTTSAPSSAGGHACGTVGGRRRIDDLHNAKTIGGVMRALRDEETIGGLMRNDRL